MWLKDANCGLYIAEDIGELVETINKPERLASRFRLHKHGLEDWLKLIELYLIGALPLVHEPRSEDP